MHVDWGQWRPPVSDQISQSAGLGNMVLLDLSGRYTTAKTSCVSVSRMLLKNMDILFLHMFK